MSNVGYWVSAKAEAFARFHTAGSGYSLSAVILSAKQNFCKRKLPFPGGFSRISEDFKQIFRLHFSKTAILKGSEKCKKRG
jgi:hypothetical protein